MADRSEKHPTDIGTTYAVHDLHSCKKKLYKLVYFNADVLARTKDFEDTERILASSNHLLIRSLLLSDMTKKDVSLPKIQLRELPRPKNFF